MLSRGTTTAPRDPSRPAAKHLPDVEALRACAVYTEKGLPHPYDILEAFPRKVVAAKLHKIHHRGLIDAKHRLTKAGRAALDEAEWK